MEACRKEVNMYIKVEELKKYLSNPAWRYYRDTNGHTVMQLIDKCEKFDEPKKSSKKKGGK